MLKNSKSIGVVSLLSISLVANSVSFAVMTTAQAAEQAQASLKDARFNVIAKALKNARKSIDSKTMTEDAAAKEFTQALVEKNVTLEDLGEFVKKTQSTRSYAIYQDSIKNALSGVGSTQSVSGKEFSEIASVAMKGTVNNGLAYLPCEVRVAGILLIVAGVAMVLIGAFKKTNDTKIKQDYQNRRQERTLQYNADRDSIVNYNIVIPQQIVSINGKINDNNIRIAYLQGKKSNLDPETAEYKNIVNEISDLVDANAGYTSEITQLTLRMSYLSNDDNRNRELAQIQLDYDTTIAQMNQDEQAQLARIPQNKKVAERLFIIGGSSAGLGLVGTLAGRCE